MPHGCGSAFVTRIFTLTSPRTGSNPGTENVVAVSVYPNPTTGAFTVETQTPGVSHVFAIDGRQVAQYVIKDALTSLVLPNTLASGTYMCRFNGDDGSVVVVRLVYKP